MNLLPRYLHLAGCYLNQSPNFGLQESCQSLNSKVVFFSYS